MSERKKLWKSFFLFRFVQNSDFFNNFFENLRKPKRRWRLPVSSLPSLRFVANMGTIWSYSVNLPGECIVLNDGGYRCECTGTGYHGETCHKGGLTFLPKNEFPSRETRWQVVVVAWFYSRNLLFILFPNTPQHYKRFQYSVLNWNARQCSALI